MAIRSEPMRYFIIIVFLGSCTDCCPAQTPLPGKLVSLQLESTLVPGPAAVDVLLPPGYEQYSEPVPLLIWLIVGSQGLVFCRLRYAMAMDRNSWTLCCSASAAKDTTYAP